MTQTPTKSYYYALEVALCSSDYPLAGRIENSDTIRSAVYVVASYLCSQGAVVMNDGRPIARAICDRPICFLDAFESTGKYPVPLFFASKVLRVNIRVWDESCGTEWTSGNEYQHTIKLARTRGLEFVVRE